MGFQLLGGVSRAAQFPKLCRPQVTQTPWVAPMDPAIKINFDVGFINETTYQVAAIARKGDGGCVGWRVRRFTGQPPAVVREARAALECVLLARERGWENVVVEGDCSEILSAIQNLLEDSFLSYGATIKHLLQLVGLFHSFSSNFTRRSGNRLAHALSHLSLGQLDVLEGLILPADLALII